MVSLCVFLFRREDACLCRDPDQYVMLAVCVIENGVVIVNSLTSWIVLRMNQMKRLSMAEIKQDRENDIYTYIRIYMQMPDYLPDYCLFRKMIRKLKWIQRVP